MSSDDTINQKTIWFPCLWCKCIFLTENDLKKHHDAFRITGYKPTEYDHKVFWANELKKRDHEYLGQEGY
jgi:hypothetical protein